MDYAAARGRRWPLLTCLVVLCCLAAGPVRAASFLPHFYGYDGDLTTEYRYRLDDEKRDATNRARKTSSKTKERDGYFDQSLNLNSAGYVYHPNLLYFELNGSGYYEHERKKNAYSNPNGTVKTYNKLNGLFGVKGRILRRKPLNFDFYYDQQKPSLGSDETDEKTTDITNSGLKMHYRKKGFNGTMSYDRQYQATERLVNRASDAWRKDEYTTDTYDAFGSYYRDQYAALKKINLSLWGSHQETTDEEVYTKDKTYDSLNLTGNFNYSIFDFNNTYSYHQDDTDSTENSATETNTTQSVGSQVRAKLPWNLTSNLRYHLNTNDNDRRDESGRVSKSKSDVSSYYVDLQQRLFKSLVTTARASMTNHKTRRNSSTNGSLDEKRFSLGTHYTKILPHNSHLEAGLGTESVWEDQDGALRVDDELHGSVIVPVAGDHVTFSLVKLDADPNSTVEVWVKKRDAYATPSCTIGSGDGWIRLTRNDNYPASGYPQTPNDEGHYGVEIDNVTSGVDVTIFGAFYDDTQFNSCLGDGAADPNFTFKVSYQTKDTTYTVRTDKSDFFVTLDYQEFLRAHYAHTVHDADLSNGDADFWSQLNRVSHATDDLLTLDATYANKYGAYRGGVSYQNQDYDTTQEIYALKLNYTQSALPTGADFIKAHLALDYNYRYVDGDETGGDNTLASYDFGVVATVPRVLVTLAGNSSYQYLRGHTDVTTLGDKGTLQTTTSLGDRDIFENSISAHRSFLHPYTKIKTHVWASGDWRRTTGEQDTSLTEYEYGIRSNRDWKFGKTTFTVTADYTIKQTIDKDHEAATEDDRTRHDARILFKMVRLLF